MRDVGCYVAPSGGVTATTITICRLTLVHGDIVTNLFTFKRILLVQKTSEFGGPQDHRIY